jgi:hypothetical protein
MAVPNLENIQPEGAVEEVKEVSLEELFEPSFKYHAVSLDKQMVLDENGTPFTLKELIDLKELREEPEWSKGDSS